MYKILVVEDDPDIAGSITKKIETWGNEVRQVEDFSKVMELFMEFAPHLV